MRIALVNTNKSSKLYPIALLKIGAYLKDKGNDCILFDNKLPAKDEFDEIWLTTLFTFDIPYSKGFVKEAKNRCKTVYVGGVAASLLPKEFERYDVNVHIGLMPEVEKYSPDYSLLNENPEYSISYLSRGCIRKCEFCMVPKLEGKLTSRENWINDLNKSTKVLFYDNNWLAVPKTKFKEDCELLHKLVRAKRITNIDFNQGLDCRLMTEEKADILKGLPIKPIRFAFDGMHEDGYYQKAVEMMAKRGYKNFITYVLYNFTDKPDDFYYRLKESVRLSDKFRMSVDSFPMRYQPILDINNKRNYSGINWAEKQKSNFVLIRAQHSFAGQITCSGGHFDKKMDEFEYWFGKDDKEFVKLLNYPNLRLLMQRKKSALRLKRAKHEI